MAHSPYPVSSALALVSRLMLAAWVLLAGVACGASTPVPHAAAAGTTAQQVVTEMAGLVPSSMPGTVFTAQTDPDHLLGQAGGYLSKAAFFDSRIDPGTASENNGGIQRGGLVEVFTEEQGAARRMQYLQEQGPPFGEEYLYVSGPILVRVANGLTPWQSSEYATALTEIAAATAEPGRAPA